MEQYENMTNVELKEACVDLGLEVKSKSPGKPNKTEYIEALTADKEAKELAKKKVAESKLIRTPRKLSKAQAVKLDALRKERVIVRDMQESQTKDELLSVSWGNPVVGFYTDMIDLSGEPQFIHRGALFNLRSATMTIKTPKASGGYSATVKKRFVIVEAEKITQKELDELAALQKMRNSKAA